MATTYEPIATVNLNSLNTVTFSTISGAYTDLRIVVAGSIAAGAQNMNLRFNGDTNTNYSRTFMGGTGSSVDSGRESNYSYITLDRWGYFTTSETNYIVDINNYSNTTTYKTVLARSNNASSGVGAVVGLWRNTAAVTSITLYLSGSTWTANSTASLYGIKAA